MEKSQSHLIFRFAGWSMKGISQKNWTSQDVTSTSFTLESNLLWLKTLTSTFVRAFFGFVFVLCLFFLILSTVVYDALYQRYYSGEYGKTAAKIEFNDWKWTPKVVASK